MPTSHMRSPECRMLPAVKIGRPGYRVTKQFDAVALQKSLLFQVRAHLVMPGRAVDDAQCRCLEGRWVGGQAPGWRR